MLWQWTICEPRTENLTEAVGPHYKRKPPTVIVSAIRMLQRHTAAVDNISHPFAVNIFAVPDFPIKANDPMQGIPGLSLEIHSGPIVNDPSVQRPSPGKLRITSDIAGTILLFTTL